jgi:hypothetical protein
MYARILFAALITSIATSSVFAREQLADGHEFGPSAGILFQVVDDATLRSYIEGSVATIDKIAHSTWTAEQKLSAIQAEYRKVEAYRKTSWSRSPATELKLDYLVGPYETFPHAENFRKSDCDSYFNTLKSEWDPTSEGVPTVRGLKRAWGNLKAICEG